MLIPHSEAATIAPEKVRDYLLSPTHPAGQYEAAFFRKLRYTQSAWRQLEGDLRRLLSADAEMVDSTEFGCKCLVRGLIGKHPWRRVKVVSV